MILQGLSAEHLARLLALSRHEGDDGGFLAELPIPEPETDCPEAEGSAFRLAAE